MQYLIRCGCLLLLLAAGCTARMKGYADTSAPPTTGIDPPAGSAPAAPETPDKAAADAKSDEKPAADEAAPK